jgi:hypothetical protein
MTFQRAELGDVEPKLAAWHVAMKRLRLLVFCATLCGCAAGSPASHAPVAQPRSTTPASAASPAISLNVCFSNQGLLGAQTIGLRRVIESVNEALLAFGSKPARIGVGPCEDESFRGCFARPEVIACRADDLAQLALAASIGAELIADVPSVRERFTTTGAMGPSDAIAALARSEVDDAPAESRQSLIARIADELRVPREVITDAVASGTRFMRDDGVPQLPIGADAFKLMLDFVVGHELFHGLGAVCAEGRPAVSEEDALFDFATASASSGRPFCQNSPSTDELLADRCGLRALRYSQRVDLGQGPDAQLKATLASELLAWALMTAHHEELLLDEGFHQARLTPGHLHPALRVLLTTNELKRLARSDVPARLCDRVARNVAIAIQNETQSCPNNERMLDEQLVRRLPKGVAQALAGQTAWSDESYWCDDSPTAGATVHPSRM